MNKPLKIIVAGEGGQGVQVIGKTLSVAAFLDGRKTTYIPNYGVEQRGGVSLSFTQVSETDIPFPKFAKTDVLVVLCHRAIERTERYITPETLYIYDKEQISAKDIAHIKCHKIGLEGQDYAKKYLTQKVANVIYLSAVSYVSHVIGKEAVVKALEKNLGAKIQNDPKLHQLNMKALEVGERMVKAEVMGEKKEAAHV